jgi:hypothetical protein
MRRDIMVQIEGAWIRVRVTQVGLYLKYVLSASEAKGLGFDVDREISVVPGVEGPEEPWVQSLRDLALSTFRVYRADGVISWHREWDACEALEHMRAVLAAREVALRFFLQAGGGGATIGG